MRRAVLAGAISLGLAGSALRPETAAAQRFQGMMRFTVHDENGRTTEITELAKAGKTSFMAAESGKPTGGMIVDSTAGTMMYVDGENKTYTVINLAMLQGMASMMKGMPRAGGMNADSSSDIKGTITPTGRSEVVAGVKCQVYTYDATNNGRHGTGEVCLAKGVGLMAGGDPLSALPGVMGMQQRQMFQQRLRQWGPFGTLLAQGYGILKATNYENGKLQGSMEVTAFQPGAPPDAAFQPPAGYAEKSAGDMMGGRRH